MSTPSRAKRTGPVAPPRKRRTGIVVATVAGAVVVAALVAALARGTRHDPAGSSATGAAEVHPVVVTGTPLAPLPDKGVADPALGQRPPELDGQTFDGSRLSIVPGGKRKLVVFIAHWCPHCRAEVPRIVQWMSSGSAPTNLDVVAVSTAVNRSPDNYPPSAWLSREHFTVPALTDDAGSSAAQAWGLPGYPYLVLLNVDGTVAARMSGEFADVAALDAWVRTGTGST